MRARLLLGVLVVGAVLAACGSSSSSSSSSRPTYYVSVGDSLSVGVQPNQAGQSLPTNQGYADVLYGQLRSSRPTLQLVKFGCSGETTESLTNGGICKYPQGNQLSAATDFLRAHQGSVSFLTIDIGANDVDDCAPGGSINIGCVTNGFTRIENQLPPILQQLRSAGGPQLKIIGLNLYDPFLALYVISPPNGQAISNVSISFADQLNAKFASIYGAAGDRVADVAKAFSTDNTSPTTLAGHGTVPTNVARICQWTWMCAPKPVGPNIHANATGYQQMAGAIKPLV